MFIPLLGLIIWTGQWIIVARCSAILYFLFFPSQDTSFCCLTTLNSFFGEEQSLFSCSIFIVLSFGGPIPSWVSSFWTDCRWRTILVLLFYIYCSLYCMTHPSVGSHHSEQIVGEEQSLFCCSITTDLYIGGPIPSCVSWIIILNSLSVKTFHCSAVLHYIYCSPCYRTHPSVGSHHPEQPVGEEQTLFCRGHEWLQVSQKIVLFNLVRLWIAK